MNNTHRCKKLLENRMSLRYHKNLGKYDYKKNGWYLGKKTYTEWGDICLETIGRVNYCPFCGAKLDEVEE